MYSLLIVDDEPLVRLALQQTIHWASIGFSRVEEASNGLEAWALLKEKPVDVLLLDIKMPKMSGIDLLREVARDKQLSERVVTVVLSAYHDYAYVREAFLLGASDYIIKANMDEKHILPVMQKAMQKVRAARQFTNQPALPAPAEAAPDIGEEEQWIALLTLDPDKDAEEISRIAGAISFPAANQVVAVIQLAGGREIDSKQKYIRQTVWTVLKPLGIPAMFCRMEAKEYALILAFPQERSAAGIHEKVNTIIQMIRIRLLQFVNLSVSVGVSELGQGAEWGRLYRKARCLAEKKYFVGYGHTFFPETAIAGAAEKEKTEPFPSGLLAQRSKLVQAVGQDSSMLWKEIWHNICSQLKAHSHVSPGEIRSYFVDLIWELGSLLYSCERRWEDVDGTFSHPEKAIRLYDTLSETIQGLEAVIEKIHHLMHVRAHLSEKRLSWPVAKAKQILDHHYCEDVNLKMVSDLVGVSESYLSKKFVKEMGCNFIQYVTKLRIEKAKQLLAEGTKVADVAERIGYWNPEHFSRLFKKMTGISPKDYRNTV